MPKNDLEWIITSSGILKVSWLKKIADYMENEKVKLELTLDGTNDTQIVKGTAQEIIVKSLRFGANYNAKIIGSSAIEEMAEFQFLARE